MAFCSNCGNEILEGTKFCPNCGTQVGTVGINQESNSNVTNNQANVSQQNAYFPPQPVSVEQKSGLDKFGKFFGIVLFILAIVDYNSDPPIVTILLSAFIIAGAVFCLGKKYKLKGFTIIALIMAAFCLFAGVGQAKKYGMFTIPKEYEYASKSSTKELPV